MGTSVTVQDSWVIYCFGKKPLFFASVNVTSLYYSSTGCRNIFGVVFVKCNLGVLNGPVCRASEYLRVSCDIHQPDLSNSWLLCFAPPPPRWDLLAPCLSLSAPSPLQKDRGSLSGSAAHKHISRRWAEQQAQRAAIRHCVWGVRPLIPGL